MIATHDAEVVVELEDGRRLIAASLLSPEVAVGDYVLVDRGLVVQVIDAEEAQAIIALYAEMSMQDGV